MAIARVSGVGGASSNPSGAGIFPAHSAGDFMFIYMANTASNTIPTKPAGTWIDWPGTTTHASGARWAYKFAASSSESSGVWTNATHCAVHVYSGVGGPGAVATNNGSSTSVGFPALTLSDNSGSSWGIRVMTHKAASNSLTNLCTTVPNTSVGGVSNRGRSYDSNGGISANPTAGTQAVNLGGAWIALTLEILAAVDLTPVDTSSAFFMCC